MERPNQDWLTEITGDPFADAGAAVIKYLKSQPHLKNKTTLELIEYITEIYVNKWGGKLNAFFLNSTITQPAFKGDRKISETIRYYQSLLDESASGDDGYCRISGRKTKVFPAGRDNYILSGSGTFINFNHSFETGLFLSKEMLIRVFFAPFGVMQLSDKIALITSNNEKVSEYFVFQNCQHNFQALASGLSEGISKSEYNNSANALFSFAEKAMSSLAIVLYDEDNDETKTEEITLNLYHFTNFGATPEVLIYTFPSVLFKFHARCLNTKHKSVWQQFIRYHYRNSKFKDAFYNEKSEVWQRKKEAIDFATYKIWRNVIFDKLLSNKSILPEMIRWAAHHKFPYTIVEVYQTLIRNMDKRTIVKLKQLADFIVSNKDADYINKSISRLNREKSIHGLRQFMLKLNAQNYRNEAKDPLINLKDYTEYLFPDGSNWREVRDVLLIAIYENMHALQVKIDVEPIEEETEQIES